MMGWQWHQLDHMQSFSPCSRHITSSLSFLQAGCPSCRPTNSVKALKTRILQQKINRKLKPGLVASYIYDLWPENAQRCRPEVVYTRRAKLVTLTRYIGVRSIVMSVSVCLSVRSHVSKTTRLNCTKFSARVTRGRGSVLL